MKILKITHKGLTVGIASSNAEIGLLVSSSRQHVSKELKTSDRIMVKNKVFHVEDITEEIRTYVQLENVR